MLSMYTRIPNIYNAKPNNPKIDRNIALTRLPKYSASERSVLQIPDLLDLASMVIRNNVEGAGSIINCRTGV